MEILVENLDADTLQLSVLLPEMELEGMPVYRWKVIFPDQTVQYYAGPSITLPASTRSYDVEVVVGETLHIRRRI
jgi:hypothetical protein